MTRSQFRTLALSALMASALSLPALAEEAAAASAPGMNKERPEGGPGGRMKPEERFKQDDTNSDGFLTKDEMLTAHKKRIDEIFERLDANKDGKLAQDEMKKGRDEMRAKMKERMKERREKMGEHGDMPMSEKPE